MSLILKQYTCSNCNKGYLKTGILKPHYVKCPFCKTEHIKRKGFWFPINHLKLIEDILKMREYIERRFGEGTYNKWWKEIQEEI